MDITFIQDAEHDVDRDESGQDQQRFVRQRSLERLRRSLEAAANAGRKTDALRRLARSPVTASPSELPGARLNDSVTAGNCPWRLMTSGVVGLAHLGKHIQVAPVPPPADRTSRNCSASGLF